MILNLVTLVLILTVNSEKDEEKCLNGSRNRVFSSNRNIIFSVQLQTVCGDDKKKKCR